LPGRLNRGFTPGHGFFARSAARRGPTPSSRANGSRECAPNDRLCEAIQRWIKTDCFVALLLATTALFENRIGKIETVVPLAGIEPALLAELDFESSASTSSATGAFGRLPTGEPSQSRRNIAGRDCRSTWTCRAKPHFTWSPGGQEGLSVYTPL
jgi:hypothetical protein